jgi:prepilin-type N-terminal cleavage/methylation domain-containing protein
MNRGLTLIELVVSVAIVGLLAVAGAIAVAQIKDSRVLSSSAAELAVVIERARALSQAPLADPSYAGYKSYGVVIDKNGRRYSLEAGKKEDGTGGKKTIETFVLDEGVSFDTLSLGGKSAIYFGIEKNGEISNLTGVANPSITLIRGGESKRIKISNPYGVVEIE